MEFGKLEKNKVWRNLVGARNLEGLGTSGRLGLEDLLLFMYPNYAEGFDFLFDNTSCVVLVFASLFP